MMKTIILLTGVASQQFALTELLKAHNPSLSFRCSVTADDLAAIEPEVLRDARLLAFTTSVIVPESMLAAFGHGAYNFHPGPPQYPGWAPAHFALYDGARTFGATAHVMAAPVDAGPIVGVESFIIPDKISVRGLEQIAYVRLAHLFWRMSRDLACDPSPLKELDIAWCGIKSTRRMYREMCELPAGISAGELARRIRAFHDDFRGIPLTVSLHGIRFQLATTATQTSEAPQVVSPPLAAVS
ncbi:methionyl-tRNA formyltransferase [Bradyrhizobium septentrionale]|uniref:Methionyl-tRNA formyltransferase n=1 Tax=Bradyrhizobium septentrionale TaxID=1404411 RepID=A0A974A3T2_9BRAD|nr:formyltransferase family protein [Bradyrhizobium septentrionale]UGY20857.1 methionyl-tRNA formyltransferase [Bradyrhizobium septentrionale]UGY29880.1 methionyl-tRNA formyltransferase [Bradyrhizobium septentrionale]